MEYMWLVIQSLDWSSITLGLILAGISALALYIRKRRKRIKAWWAERRAHSAALRQLPMSLMEARDNFRTLVESNARTTLQFTNIDEQLKSQTATLHSQNVMLADITAMAHGRMELDSKPLFVCDNTGRNRYVNTAYARMVGCGRDELTGYGYYRFIPTALNPTYLTGFATAALQHRTFEEVLIMVRPDGTKFAARVRIVPHPEDVPPATHWNGMLVFLHEVEEDDE